jgi:anaerobic magnesium-protoporphyrin IX monomethyl ester cyclase
MDSLRQVGVTRSVVLVYPRMKTGWEAQPWCDIPMGLVCVGSPVRRLGYRVRLIDQRVTPDWESILRDELGRDPVCVGISSMTGPQLRHAMEVSRIVRENSRAPVIWGGVHPSIMPEQTLAHPDIDVIVQGEGDATFADLVQALDSGRDLSTVPGIWYKQEGRCLSTGRRAFVDPDLQPPLDFDLVDVGRYTRRVFGVNRVSFMTSQGCPYPCAFCFNTVFHRRTWRALSADVALDRIEDFVRRYSVQGLFLTDSNFFVDLDRARQILQGVIDRKLDVVFTRIHVRLDALAKMTDADLSLLERAGCRCVAIGIESGSERIRQLLHKPIDVDQLLEINRRLCRFSIAPLYFFMIGFPTETEAELSQSIELMTRLVAENPRAIKSANIYVPYPGTELFSLAVQCGLKEPSRIEDWFSFSYRELSSAGSWLTAKMRARVRMIDFCAQFLGDRSYLKPIKATHPMVVLLANLYAPVARKRIEWMFSGFPLEIILAKKLGLYAKQE